MCTLKIITLSHSKYNVLLYLFIQTCYLNKRPLLGDITLNVLSIFVIQYIKPSSNVHKDNIVMFSVSNKMILLP